MSHRRVSVRFVLNSLPHYRRALFEALQGDPDLSISWTSSSAAYGAEDVPQLTDPLVDLEIVSTTVFLKRFLWQRGVAKRALLQPPDVTVFTGDVRFMSTWIALIILRVRRRRALLWTHGWSRVDRGLKKHVRLCFYRLSAGLLLYGRRAEHLSRALGYGGPTYVVFNSMRRSLPAPARVEGVRDGQHWIVVTRLIPSRRIDAVIRACASLAEHNRTVHLTIIGDGPDREGLERLAASTGIKVTFKGPVYDQDAVDSMVRDSDILVSPGNVGLAAIHALSLGCPVATNSDMTVQMPEAEAITHLRNGVLVDPSDAAKMAQTIWTFVDTSTREARVADSREEIRLRWLADNQARLIVEAILG